MIVQLKLPNASKGVSDLDNLIKKDLRKNKRNKTENYEKKIGLPNK